MSKVAIKGAASGTATFTIESPATNTDRVLVLPNSAGTIVSKSGSFIAPADLGSGTADNTTFLRGDSTFQTIPAPTIASTAEAQAGTNNTNFITPLRMREGFNASGSAPVYACRAWVNFDGTTNVGGNCTIRASGNVSTVADNGTGDYTVNFTTAMPDANYCTQITVSSNAPTSSNNGNQVNINSSSSGSLYTTSSFRMGILRDNGGGIADADPLIICVSIFR